MVLLVYCVVQCLLVFQLRDIVVVVDVRLTDASIVVIVVAATFANTFGFGSMVMVGCSIVGDRRSYNDPS
jgi:hypothetical protein